MLWWNPPAFSENALYFGLNCPPGLHLPLWASEANLSFLWVRSHRCSLWCILRLLTMSPVTQSPGGLTPEPLDPQSEPGRRPSQPRTRQWQSLFLFFHRPVVYLGTLNSQRRPQTGNRESVSVERLPLPLPSNRYLAPQRVARKPKAKESLIPSSIGCWGSRGQGGFLLPQHLPWDPHPRKGCGAPSLGASRV